MSLDWVVYWLAIVYCAALLANLALARFARGAGWSVKCALVLALAGLAYWRHSEALQQVTSGLWALFVAVPTLLGRLSGRDSLRGRYDRAALYLRLAAPLHPFDGWWFNREVLAALALARRGDSDRAKAKLRALNADPRVGARRQDLIRAHLLRLEEDWEALARVAGGGDARDPALLMVRLRALGETGRLPEMVALLARSPLGSSPLHLLCRLFALAFCGRVAAVTRLLPQAPLDAENKTFWLATAELAAGERERPLARLSEIAGSDNAFTAGAARRRSVSLAAPREALSIADWQTIAAIEASLDDDAAYLPSISSGLRRSYVVLGLIIANCVVFLVELAQGVAQDDAGLLRLGALQSDLVYAGGEWWRLASAIFLHYGAVHLSLNMLALAVIGVWVEQMLGRWRTLVIYFAAGLGSAAFVLQSLPPDTPMVGASGAIFGLVGAQIALVVEAWLRHRSRHAAQRLFNLCLVILLQVAFDLATPEVSGGAHAAGLVIGLATAVLLMLGHRRPAER